MRLAFEGQALALASGSGAFMRAVCVLSRLAPFTIALALVLTGACSKGADAKGGPEGKSETKAAASQPAMPKKMDVEKVTRRDKELKPLAPRAKLESPAQKTLDATLASYLKLKDALVTSDLAKATPAYAQFQKDFAALKKVTPKAEAKAVFDRSVAEVDEGTKWVADHDATLPAHRRGFAAISEGILNLAASFHHSTPVFVQYCPMALDDGALWLSTSKDIRNPYYGDRMLECGEVQGEIPAS